MKEVEDQEEYILYNIPVYIDQYPVTQFLRVAYKYGTDGEEGQYEIYGLWDEGESQEDIPSRNFIPLEEGTEITFLFPETKMNFKKALQYREGATIVYHPETTKMEERQMKDGEYVMIYEIENAFGKTEISEPIVVVCESGDIVKMTLTDLLAEEEE